MTISATAPMLDKFDIHNTRALSNDALLMVFTTLCLASYPYLIAIGWWFIGMVAAALTTVVLHHIFPNKNLHTVCFKITGYIILLTTAFNLYRQYGYVHPLTINGTVVIIAWLKFSDQHPYRDASGVLLIATILFAESMIAGYQHPFYLVSCLALILATLITINNHRLRVLSRFFVFTHGRLLLLSLPLLAILYVLFPRLPGSLFPWQIPGVNGWFDAQEKSFQQTGQLNGISPAQETIKALGETLNLDQLSTLGQSDQRVFTATFTTPPPSLNDLYWRGAVFWKYDGETWHMRRHWKRSETNPPTQQDTLNPHFPITHYKMQLPAHGRHWLYGLEFPVEHPKGTVLTNDQQLISARKLNQPFEYEVTSYLIPYPPGKLTTRERRMAHQFPRNSNPKLFEFGAKYFDPNEDNSVNVANKIASHFQNTNNGFIYDVKRFPKGGKHSMDDFMFNSKAGQCGHYASALALALRAAGVPSRLVTGFRGGRQLHSETNAYQIEVTGSMAHAWVEYWSLGNWWRIDPTLLVPGQTPNIIPATGDSYNTPAPLEDQQSNNDKKIFETFRNDLEKFIDFSLVYYNTQLQQQLLNKLGLGHLQSIHLLLLSVFTVGILWVSMGWYLNRATRDKSIDPALVCYQRLQKTLGIAGLTIKANEGPYDFMQRAIFLFPEQREEIERICLALIAIRYGKDNNLKQIPALMKSINRLNLGSGV